MDVQSSWFGKYWQNPELQLDNYWCFAQYATLLQHSTAHAGNAPAIKHRPSIVFCNFAMAIGQAMSFFYDLLTFQL